MAISSDGLWLVSGAPGQGAVLVFKSTDGTFSQYGQTICPPEPSSFQFRANDTIGSATQGKCSYLVTQPLIPSPFALV